MRTIEEILKEINMYELNESNLTELIDMYITKYAERRANFDIKAIPFLCKSIIEDLEQESTKPHLEEKLNCRFWFGEMDPAYKDTTITNNNLPFMALGTRDYRFTNKFNTSWEYYYHYTSYRNYNDMQLMIKTKKNLYYLTDNCLFKFNQDTEDIYTYYTFKETGEIKEKVFVDKIKGVMQTDDATYSITKKDELINRRIKPGTVSTEEELLNLLYEPKLISKVPKRKSIIEALKEAFNEDTNKQVAKNLDIKPKALEPVMYTLTDKGRVRSKNEDSIIAISHPESESIKLLAVADGMGGYSNGEYASSYTIERLKEWFNNRTAFEFNNLNYLNTNLQELIQDINVSLHKESRKRLNEMGTTLTCAIVTNNKTLVLNIGDSRCYLMKDTNLKQITDDDSTVYEQYEAGILTKDDLRFHPRNNIVTQGLGISNVSPRTKIIDNDSYDKLLLFTDGVTDCLSDDRIKLIANTYKKEEILEKIIDEAVNVEQAIPKELSIPYNFRTQPTPGKDNATGAILIKR